jgi:ubiquinone/menaquinone biosynthesis C-methylase UbiE
MAPMAQPPIRFADGAAYEHTMGPWTQAVGEIFLDWLTPPAGQTWLDVGCGNAAFTELIVRRHAPAEVQGIDPSVEQLAFARSRPGAAGATFQQGTAIDLPFSADRFDAAVMALVIGFLPDPAKGVSEMTRVVRPGGLVAAYTWDQLDGGYPFEPILRVMRAMGVTPILPPSPGASRMEALRGLWADAGLVAVETKAIPVRRVFDNFDDFWRANTATGPLPATLGTMDAGAISALKDRVRATLPPDDQGRIAYGSVAHAVKGQVPRP